MVWCLVAQPSGALHGPRPFPICLHHNNSLSRRSADFALGVGSTSRRPTAQRNTTHHAAKSAQSFLHAPRVRTESRTSARALSIFGTPQRHAHTLSHRRHGPIRPPRSRRPLRVPHELGERQPNLDSFRRPTTPRSLQLSSRRRPGPLGSKRRAIRASPLHRSIPRNRSPLSRKRRSFGTRFHSPARRRPQPHRAALRSPRANLPFRRTTDRRRRYQSPLSSARRVSGNPQWQNRK